MDCIYDGWIRETIIYLFSDSRSFQILVNYNHYLWTIFQTIYKPYVVLNTKHINTSKLIYLKRRSCLWFENKRAKEYQLINVNCSCSARTEMTMKLFHIVKLTKYYQNESTCFKRYIYWQQNIDTTLIDHSINRGYISNSSAFVLLVFLNVMQLSPVDSAISCLKRMCRTFGGRKTRKKIKMPTFSGTPCRKFEG